MPKLNKFDNLVNTGLYVNGKPFFPMGMFAGWEVDTFANLASIGMNTVLIGNRHFDKMPEILEEAKTHNLQVIAAWTNSWCHVGGLGKYNSEHDAIDYFREIIRKYKNHPNLLAWYIIDEGDHDDWGGEHCWGIPLTYGMMINKMFKEEDPDHPTESLIMGWKKYAFGVWKDTGDIQAFDMFPVWDRAESLKSETNNRKLFFPTPGYYKYHGYTREKMCTQLYQSIIHGAGGIIMWSYSDIITEPVQWQELGVLVDELNTLFPIILPPSVTLEEASCSVGNIHILYKKTEQDKRYLITTNIDETNPIIGVKINVKGLRSGAKIKLLFEEREIIASDGYFIDNYAKGERHVYDLTDAFDTTPPGTTTLSVSQITSTSITLGWITPGDDGSIGTATNYDIRYATFTITEDNWHLATRVSDEPFPTSAGNQATYTITHLIPDILYYFGLKTSDEVPNTSPLSTVSATTMAVPAYHIKGYIKDNSSLGLEGVMVKLSGLLTRECLTRADGSYEFLWLPAGTYTLIPIKLGYKFTPDTRHYALYGDYINQDFGAEVLVWPLFHRDVYHTSQSPYYAPSNPVLKWKYLIGTISYSSSVIGQDGTIYIGALNGSLYAIGPEGNLKWSYQTGDKITSSPAIGLEGTIYVGSYDKNLYFINPDGSLKGSFTTGGSIHSAPTIAHDGTIYIGALNGSLYAISPEGNLKWDYKTGGKITSSPAIGLDGTIYIGSYDKNLYFINPDGSLKGVYNTQYGIPSSPAIASEGTIYVSDDGSLYSFNSNGSLRWKSGVWGYSSSAIGKDGTVYLGSTHNKRVDAFNPDGSRKWSDGFYVGDKVDSSPAIDANGYVYIGADNGYLYCLSPTDGLPRWKYQTNGCIRSSPAIGKNADIYFGSEDGYLYCLTEDTGELDHFEIEHINNQVADSPFNLRIRAIDGSGRTILRFASTATLTDNSSSINPGKITFTNGLFEGNVTITAPYTNNFITVASFSRQGTSNPFNVISKGPLLADSPQPMFMHDLRHTGRSEYKGPEQAVLKWIYSLSNGILSSPVIDRQETIYFGSYDKYLYAVRFNGIIKWRYPFLAHISSSPALASDGSIYVTCENGNLYSLDQYGRLKWSYPTEGPISSSPAIGANGNIYFGSEDKHLYCLNPDGSLKWKYKSLDKIFSSPAIDEEGNIYFGSYDHYLYSLSAVGNLRWKYLFSGAIYKSSPTIDNQGNIYIGSNDGYLYSVCKNGILNWRHQVKCISSTCAIGKDGTIYVASEDNNLYALNSDGSLKWSYKTQGRIYSSPLIDSDSNIYIGSTDHNLYSIDKNGEFRWKYQIKGNIVTTPAIGFSKTIYISSDNRLYAFAGSDTTTFIILKKTADKKWLLPDGTITYTITYKNEGDTTATDVTIIEVLPEKTKLIGIRDSGFGIRYWYDNTWQEEFNDKATKIRWIILSVAPGQEGSFSFVVKVR